MIVKFTAELWIWDARRADSWAFVSLPEPDSQTIREVTEGLRRGFGSLRVRATVGGSVWTTSIFPDSKRSCFVLPVKKAVRKAEDLQPGDTASVSVELLDL